MKRQFLITFFCLIATFINAQNTLFTQDTTLKNAYGYSNADYRKGIKNIDSVMFFIFCSTGYNWKTKKYEPLSSECDSLGNYNIRQFKNLKLLTITERGEKYLPPNFLNTSIEYLILRKNYFTSIPEEINKLYKLKELYIDGNEIETISEEFINSKKSLESLNINSNKIKKIPRNIIKLSYLQRLDIGFNPIKALPKLWKLKTLERLYVSGTKLTKLPKHLNKYKALAILDVADSDIKFSLKEIKKLHLKYFECNFNQIKDATYNETDSFDDTSSDLKKVLPNCILRVHY